MVGAKGSHISEALLLHHPYRLLIGQLQERVVQLANVVVECYVSGYSTVHVIIFTSFCILVNVDDVGQLREEKREEEGGKTSHQKVAELLGNSQLRTEGGL